jgi:hypothetical protein
MKSGTPHLRAERTGNVAESTILGTLQGRGYALVQLPTRREIAEARQPSLFAEPRPVIERYVVRQYPLGDSIYESPLFADFAVFGSDRFAAGLIIESKWQQSGGSVDEKFPYLVENIRSVYSMPCVLVVDGGGHRPGSLKWLRRQVDNERLLAVFSLSEFVGWANRNL